MWPITKAIMATAVITEAAHSQFCPSGFGARLASHGRFLRSRTPTSYTNSVGEALRAFKLDLQGSLRTNTGALRPKSIQIDERNGPS